MRQEAHRFERWANSLMPIGTGLKMLSAQAANEALRHCRIGMVTKKTPRPPRRSWVAQIAARWTTET